MDRLRWREKTLRFEERVLLALDTETVGSAVLIGAIDLLVGILHQNVD
jgi:hypothetical protein